MEKLHDLHCLKTKETNKDSLKPTCEDNSDKNVFNNDEKVSNDHLKSRFKLEAAGA